MRCSNCEALNLDDARICYNCGSTLSLSDSPFAPPLANVETRKGGFRPIWILWGCGGIFVLILLLLGSCFVVAKNAMGVGEREFAPAVESYLQKVNVGDYHGAYAEFGKEMHTAVTEADYVSLDMGMHEKLGALRLKKLQFIQAGKDFNGTWGGLVYQCEFERAKGTINIGLKKEGEVWKIINVRYDSPIFMDSLRSKTKQNS